MGPDARPPPRGTRRTCTAQNYKLPAGPRAAQSSRLSATLLFLNKPTVPNERHTPHLLRYDCWVSHATRLARYAVPRCWASHTPRHKVAVYYYGGLCPPFPLARRSALWVWRAWTHRSLDSMSGPTLGGAEWPIRGEALAPLSHRDMWLLGRAARLVRHANIACQRTAGCPVDPAAAYLAGTAG